MDSGPYDIPARRISGTREQKLEQLEAAIQQLLAIKARECAPEQPGVHFLAAPRRSHWLGMMLTLLALLVMLLWIGVGVPHP